MIDRVSIIWADGSANTEFPLTGDLYPLKNVVALTAVFGPSSDKLSTYTIIRVPDGDPGSDGFHYRTQLIEPDGTMWCVASEFEFRKAVDSLLAEVKSVFGEDGE